MRDLLQHIGMVHRFAVATVARRSAKPMTDDEQLRAVGSFPPDALLTGWFLKGHAALVETLRCTGPQARCWTSCPRPHHLRSGPAARRTRPRFTG